VRILALVVVGTLSLLAALPFALVGDLLFRRKLTIVISVVAALWYSGLLETIFAVASSAVQAISFGQFQLSTLLTIGTLVAVIYAALNSDVRGRAEMNKTAGERSVSHSFAQTY
jgi:hypothetical protein